jgi:hypothetical protein
VFLKFGLDGSDLDAAKLVTAAISSGHGADDGKVVSLSLVKDGVVYLYLAHTSLRHNYGCMEH